MALVADGLGHPIALRAEAADQRLPWHRPGRALYSNEPGRWRTLFPCPSSHRNLASAGATSGTRCGRL